MQASLAHRLERLIEVDATDIVSVALLFEPILGTVIGYFLLGGLEVGHWTLLGGALMIAGASILSSWLERRVNPK